MSINSINVKDCVLQELNVPTLIDHGFDLSEYSNCTKASLKKKYPKNAVILAILQPGQNILGPNCCKKTVFLSEALELIENNNDVNKCHYLMQQSLDRDFPELLTELALPDIISSLTIYKKNIWISEIKANTRLHYDFFDNILIHIEGRKRIRLYPPSDSGYLYPYPSCSHIVGNYPHVHFSEINDTELVDPKQFPDFSNASTIEVTLEPGDMLFIPAGWWHEVRSLLSSVSLNFWWKTSINKLDKRQRIALIESYNYWLKDISKLEEQFV